MSWMMMAVCALFVISIIIGLWKGAIKIVVSLMTTLLVMGLVFVATPYVTGFITSVTPVSEMIEEQITKSTLKMASGLLHGETADGQMSEESVRLALKAAGVTEEELEEMGISIKDIVEGKVTSEDLAEYGISSSVLSGAKLNEVEVKEEELTELPRDVQIAAIKNAGLPEAFENLLLVNNNEEIYQKLGAENFISYVSKYLTKLIINIVAFLLTFIVVTIIVRAIVLALDIISNLPVLGFVNRLAGGILGMSGALIVVWIFFIAVTLLYSTAIGQEMYTMIQEEPILEMLYEYNPIMKLATTLK